MTEVNDVPRLGMVGLGKMGANMAARLRAAGLGVEGFDTDPELSDHPTLQSLVEALPSPRVVWVMVPAGAVTAAVIGELGALLDPGDLVVDGGNSRWTDDAAHAESLAARGVKFVDCGVSGGIWGREQGYALMLGGSEQNVARLQPFLQALAPTEGGLVHAGDVGAGHFAKMVHNGIEYGLMQAFAEGYELLEKAPLINNVAEIFESWREGTVIRSWLLDLLAKALHEDAGLSQIRGVARDSGEGRWMVQAAIDHGVATPAISASLFARFVSQSEESAAMQAIAAMRAQFGGHAVERRTPDTP